MRPQRNRQALKALKSGSVWRPGGKTGSVPLYACERCGFTSPAFRPDAESAHRFEYPDCDGYTKGIVYEGQTDLGRCAPGGEDTRTKLYEIMLGTKPPPK